MRTRHSTTLELIEAVKAKKGLLPLRGRLAPIQYTTLRLDFEGSALLRPHCSTCTCAEIVHVVGVPIVMDTAMEGDEVAWEWREPA